MNFRPDVVGFVQPVWFSLPFLLFDYKYWKFTETVLTKISKNAIIDMESNLEGSFLNFL